MDNTKDITVLSLCTGYGGLDIGLAKALQKTLRIVAVEVEAFALANLVAKTEQGKMAIEAVWPDLRTFPAEKFRGCFDYLVAGYPCQGESVAGKRKGKDDPRWLWPHIERIVSAIRPVRVFLENVPGHLTLGFPTVYRSLRNMGYKVEAGLFSAAECGAPHIRRRLLILAYSGNGRCERPQEKIRTGRDTANSASQLANAECTEQGTGVIKETQTGIGRDRFAVGVESLADTDLFRTSPGGQDRRMGRVSQPIKKKDVPHSCRQGLQEPMCERQKPEHPGIISYWPAHPGQEQYCWEEPRTLEPGLGRAVNGTANRVDRLRLVGNGVVPCQAEKAFRILMEKFDAG